MEPLQREYDRVLRDMAALRADKLELVSQVEAQAKQLTAGRCCVLSTCRMLRQASPAAAGSGGRCVWQVPCFPNLMCTLVAGRPAM